MSIIWKPTLGLNSNRKLKFVHILHTVTFTFCQWNKSIVWPLHFLCTAISKSVTADVTAIVTHWPQLHMAIVSVSKGIVSEWRGRGGRCWTTNNSGLGSSPSPMQMVLYLAQQMDFSNYLTVDYMSLDFCLLSLKLISAVQLCCDQKIRQHFQHTI